MVDLNDPRIKLLIADCERNADMRIVVQNTWSPCRVLVAVPGGDPPYQRFEYTREELRLVLAHLMITQP